MLDWLFNTVVTESSGKAYLGVISGISRFGGGAGPGPHPTESLRVRFLGGTPTEYAVPLTRAAIEFASRDEPVTAQADIRTSLTISLDQPEHD
jgi:hypothetical protein